MVAQSLANEDRVESDLTALEIIAGPVLLIAVFLGTLLIGIKAASPVELARRRQLEFTADASHELRTPLSVIEAEVSLRSVVRSGDDYRATLERVKRGEYALTRHRRRSAVVVPVRLGAASARRRTSGRLGHRRRLCRPFPCSSS